MAAVNTKFIANPGWGIQSVGRQTVSVGFRPTINVTQHADPDEGTPEISSYVGFNDIKFGIFGAIAAVTPGIVESILGQEEMTDSLRDIINSLPLPKSVSISPDLRLKVGTSPLIPAWNLTGIYAFIEMLSENPIHVRKINVRASSPEYLPSTLEILTPSVFNGQYDRQIINIVADTNMYQNQNNIVTIDTDFYICRNSIIRNDVICSVPTTNLAPALTIDFSFDKYLSLEKALKENYELLQTDAGVQNAVAQEVQQINTIAAAKMPILQGAEMVATPANLTDKAAPSVQPAKTKGNFWI